MGGDFQQYRANVSCGRAECTYISAISEYTPSDCIYIIICP